MAELATRSQIADRRPRWRNWAQNQICAPVAIHHPTTEQQLVEIVRQAAEGGRRVKVVGSGHSFTATALTDGDLVELDRYTEVLSELRSRSAGDHAPPSRMVSRPRRAP